MSQLGNISGRTTLLMTSGQLRTSLQRTQRELLDRQDEISTGLKVSRPSDSPGQVATILSLEQKSETREQFERNLQHALSVLNNTDHALGDAHGILIEARDLASSQIGIGSDPETRRAQTTVVDSQIQALIDIGNRKFQDVALFGGRLSAGGDDGKVFSDFLGGVRYVGVGDGTINELGTSQSFGINSNGLEGFGALSTRVRGSVDLNPSAVSDTRLSDLDGAQGLGLRRKSVEVTITGTSTVSVTVDLSNADTLGDVVSRINNAITEADPTAGGVGFAPNGLSITANTGHTIEIADIGVGQTAGDLGIRFSATDGTVAGGDVQPRLTELTQLSDLGAAVDFAGGLKITQGAVTKVADFSSATTVQDLINEVDRLDLGLRLEINSDSSGLDLINEVSGLELSIGENSGGTTASDLGLRTLSEDTLLTDFRHGVGVSSIEGEDDFAFELHDGSTFNVNIDGVKTVGQLLTGIRDAATTAGLTIGDVGDTGTDFNVGLAMDGNGFVFEDTTTGGDDFRVVNLGLSLAGTDLGIFANAGASGTIVSEDKAKVRVEGVFTHLSQLRESLGSDDSHGIRFAGDGLEGDIDHAIKARADVAVRAQRVERQQERLADVGIAESILLSELRDADLTEAITRFTQLQQQLEASLRVGSLNLQLSLLDFLR